MRERLLSSLDLFEFGVEMMAARLRREHPAWSAEQVDLALEAWLATRPGAEHGDGDGDPAGLAIAASP